MSTSLRTYIAVEVENAGVLRTFGSLQRAVIPGGLSITGDAFERSDAIVIPTGGTVEVYNWVAAGGASGGATPADFEAFVLAITSEDDEDAETSAYLEVYEIIDIPTSATDLSPSGTGPHSRQFEMSNTLPYCCSSDQRKTKVTGSITQVTSLTGFSTATGTGTPDLIASTTTGKVYSIKVYNPGDFDVTIQRLRIN